MEAEQFNQVHRLRHVAESLLGELALPAANVFAPVMRARLDRIRYRFLQIDAVDSLRTWRGDDAQCGGAGMTCSTSLPTEPKDCGGSARCETAGSLLSSSPPSEGRRVPRCERRW
jgi:hypothetical protein